MASLAINSPKLLPFKSPNPNLISISKKPNLVSCTSISKSRPTHLSKHDTDTKNTSNLNKIDHWMQESVPDIVKNLKKAPLLIQVYSENGDGGIELRTDKAFVDEWPVLRNGWRNEEFKSPDGLIFVEELDESLDFDEGFEEEGEDVRTTKAWGIVVQGKGTECGPGCCYLLKTNRVCGGMGLGCCTHFCLMRVSNFRDTAFQQFRDSWLLG